MREDGFLRAPIRGDHQARLRDLTVAEGLDPQTLELAFAVDPGQTVQIAPLWAGGLQFLAYARFNALPSTARRLADDLAKNLAAWVGPPPAGNETVLYNTLQRLAVAEWHDAAAAYREAP